MYTHVTFLNFMNTMNTDYTGYFSYEGLVALFKYYTDYEENTGNAIQFDSSLINASWTEYNSKEEALADYDYDSYKDMVLDFTVIELTNGHILVNVLF